MLLAILLLHYSILSLRSFSDFGPYYKAGERFAGSENLYNFADGHYLFKYSPLAALFFAPIALLPYSTAAALWLGLSWLLLGFSYLLAKKLEWGGEPLPIWAGLLIFLGLSKFALAEIHLGQVDFLLLFLVLVALASLGRRREVFGGVLLALAVLFKPPLLLISILAVWRRRTMFLLGLGGALLVGLCLPILQYGFLGALSLYHGWWAVLSTSSPGLLASEVNQSIFGALTRWLVQNPKGRTLLDLSAEVPLILGFAALVGFLFVLWRLEKGYQSDSEHRSTVPALLIMGSVLFSPLGWVQNYVLALPALIRAVGCLVREQAQSRWRLACLALFYLTAVLPNFELLGRHFYNVYLGQSWMFLGILGLVAANLIPLQGESDGE